MNLPKKWRQKPLDFEEFKELWEGNQKREIARGLLFALQQSEHITLDDKLIILLEVTSECKFSYQAHDIAMFRQAFGYMLELQPIWNNARSARVPIIELLAQGHIHQQMFTGFEPALKKFMQSCLNAAPEAKNLAVWKEDVPQALIRLRMFEELVNYGFTDFSVINSLAKIIGIPFAQLHNNEYFISKRTITTALAENREPHAVSTLLRLVTKRDPEALFRENGIQLRLT